MSSPFATRLQEAFAPLLTRAKRRVVRLQELRAQPQTEAIAKSIAAEQREIQLVKAAAEAVSTLLTDAEANAVAWQARAEGVTALAVKAYDDATHYEALFGRAVMLLPWTPDPTHDALIARVHQFVDSPRCQERLTWPIEKRRVAARITSHQLANPQLAN